MILILTASRKPSLCSEDPIETDVDQNTSIHHTSWQGSRLNIQGAEGSVWNTQKFGSIDAPSLAVAGLMNAPGFLRKLGVQLLYMRVLWIEVVLKCFQVILWDVHLLFFSMPLAGFVAVISYKATKPQEVTAAMTSGLRHRVGLVQRKLLEVPKYNGVQFWGTRICRCSASFCSSTLW